MAQFFDTDAPIYETPRPSEAWIVHPATVGCMAAGLGVRCCRPEVEKKILSRARTLFSLGIIPAALETAKLKHYIGENMTIAKILCGCALLAFAAATMSAQVKSTISGTCGKADVEQSVPAGDQPDHVFMVAQGKCMPKGEVGGESTKEGSYSEHRDVTAKRMKAWGVYIETYDGGDKIVYTYQLSVGMKDGAMMSGDGTFQAISGTGKMKGIKAKGTCTYTPGADGASNYSCTGDYTLAGAMAAK